MQFLIVLAILAAVAMPAVAFRATPRFLGSQSVQLSRQSNTQFISKNTMLFSEEPESPPPADKGIKESFDDALFNKGTKVS